MILRSARAQALREGRLAGPYTTTPYAATPASPTDSPGRPSSASLLVACRDGRAAHGLGVNAAHTAAVLSRLGVPAEYVGTPTLDDLAKLIGPATRTVILQAIWYGPDELIGLARRHPKVRFVSRAHSNLAFLAAEPTVVADQRAMQAAGEPNLVIGAVSDRLSRWWAEAYGLPAVHLPNLYDLPDGIPARAPHDGPIKLGLFGAMRLQKHHAVGAGAALVVARRLGRPVEVYINTGRHDDRALKLVRSMFEGVDGAALVEAPWMDNPGFVRLIGRMDLCLQPSATETYNYVTADAAALSIPTVVGECIEWMPRDMMAPVDDPVAVAEAALRLLGDPGAGGRARAALEAHQRRAEWAWLDWLGPPLRVQSAHARSCPHIEAYSPEERPGCGCRWKCAAGMSPQRDMVPPGDGVTPLDCWACPIAPRRQAGRGPGDLAG